MGRERELTCPSCGLVVTPERRRLTGREIGEGLRTTAAHAIVFGWFCPSSTCRARLDKAVEEMLAAPREDDAEKRPEPAPVPALSSMTTAPKKNAPAVASPVSLFDQIRSQRAELSAKVERLRAELSTAERDLAIVDRLFAQLPDATPPPDAAPIAAE